MGSVTAIGLADSVLDLETQLAYHLQGNHYPPVPLSMVQPCIDAIEQATYNLSDPNGKMFTKIFFSDGEVSVK